MQSQHSVQHGQASIAANKAIARAVAKIELCSCETTPMMSVRSDSSTQTTALPTLSRFSVCSATTQYDCTNLRGSSACAWTPMSLLGEVLCVDAGSAARSTSNYKNPIGHGLERSRTVTSRIQNTCVSWHIASHCQTYCVSKFAFYSFLEKVVVDQIDGRPRDIGHEPVHFYDSAWMDACLLLAQYPTVID